MSLHNIRLKDAVGKTIDAMQFFNDEKTGEAKVKLVFHDHTFVVLNKSKDDNKSTLWKDLEEILHKSDKK